MFNIFHYHNKNIKICLGSVIEQYHFISLPLLLIHIKIDKSLAWGFYLKNVSAHFLIDITSHCITASNIGLNWPCEKQTNR